MDSAVSQEQKNLVDALTLELLDVCFELLEKWSEIGWPAKSYLWECLSVSGDHVLDADHFWLGRVTVDGEAVTDGVYSQVAWYTSESKARESFVTVIRLKDRAN